MSNEHTPQAADAISAPAPAPQSADQPRAVADRERKARTAFRFYRALAFVTGVMLLILVVEMIIKYVIRWEEVVPYIEWVPFAHGWIYVIYLAAVFNLWSVMRWPFKRIVFLVLAGVVPVLSFVMERRASQWFAEDLPRLIDRARKTANLAS
ncbi:DUF3817 domain-containing protein [Bogoriella caseilytica]|uniref:DUF3817 domain-containing protein n=1 Tax=Bogoriella caseilytica TaxID=56055 RepID=UPI001FE329BD|nr:DUF3817 domain-containing protein [Bogoriella caseilytica]